ncbi:GntR family transcriptional regulator [Halosegnis longus]|uniref:GntR family transcriptional regulator n=1 Tax=Halosegnis longus TaxID=2216012 RepID=UPI00096AB8E8
MSRGPDPKIDPVELLHEFVVSPDPAFVPAEIAESFDTSAETARKAMDRLVDRGLLARKKPGERTVIYWITDDGRKHYSEEST